MLLSDVHKQRFSNYAETQAYIITVFNKKKSLENSQCVVLIKYGNF